MARISFYLLKQDQAAERFLFACRLCEKILSQDLKIYIHTSTAEQARYLDDLLWSFKPESFVPHCLVDTDIDEDISVLIGYDDRYLESYDVLINLTESVPDFYAKYPRVVEIITAEESEKTQGRERWKVYKEAGHELESHQP